MHGAMAARKFRIGTIMNGLFRATGQQGTCRRHAAAFAAGRGVRLAAPYGSVQAGGGARTRQIDDRASGDSTGTMARCGAAASKGACLFAGPTVSHSASVYEGRRPVIRPAVGRVAETALRGVPRCAQTGKDGAPAQEAGSGRARPVAMEVAPWQPGTRGNQGCDARLRMLHLLR